MSLADGNTTIALADLTPAWLKTNYLAGFTLTDASGTEFPPSYYETHMQNAVRKLEKLTDVTILEKDIVGEEHDYRIGDYTAYAFIALFTSPVREVQQVRAVYPLGSVIQVFPSEWVTLEKLKGQINLVPAKGPLASMIIGQGGDFLPLVYGGVSYLPHLWRVDYTAGMDPLNLPRDVVEAIAKMACIDILVHMSNLARPLGVQSASISIDGLSQSQSYQVAAFQQQIDQYKQDLYGSPGDDRGSSAGLVKLITDTFKGPNLASLY